jgi:hypothetical protein
VSQNGRRPGGLKHKFINKKEDDRNFASVGRKVPIEFDVYKNTSLMVNGG